MLINKYIILSIFLFSSVFGSWNTSFDESTSLMLSSLIGVDSEEYEEQYKIFMQIRDKYVQDLSLKKEIAVMASDHKEIILMPKDMIVLKKRRNNHIFEVFAWEISALLGSHSCIVPSFPIDIGGKQVVMQKMEPFYIPKYYDKGGNKIIIKRVSLDAYWKAHFQAYLLGMGDLVGRNIGVNKEGNIRFFDIESSFKYQNQPVRGKQSFYTGFVSQSLAWPQFQKKIDQTTAISLKQFIASLEHFEENLDTYLTYRSLTLDREGFLYRLQKIREFSLEEGKTFEDFYKFIFPNIGLGLEELSSVVSRILQKEINHGEALIFACKKLKKTELSIKEKKAVHKWLSTYMGDECGEDL